MPRPEATEGGSVRPLDGVHPRSLGRWAPHSSPLEGGKDILLHRFRRRSGGVAVEDGAIAVHEELGEVPLDCLESQSARALSLEEGEKGVFLRTVDLDLRE